MHHGKVLLLLLVLSTSLFAKDFQGPIREDFDDLGLHDDVLIYLPSDYNELKSYPLILSLHGLGASAYIQNITFNFKEFITQKQFILVVPEGMVGMGGLHYWNATDFCCGSRQRTKVDDVEYLSSVIEKMISNYSVNPKEVHLFGHSNGGFMANRLACDVPHLFKSFASFAGTTWLDPSKCKSSSALSMLHIHGNIDNIVVYDGIEGSYPGALETTQRWVKRNNCKGTAKVSKNEIFYYRPYDKNYLTTEQSWNDCDDGTKVSLWSVEDLSHMVRFNSEYLERILDFFLEV